MIRRFSPKIPHPFPKLHSATPHRHKVNSSGYYVYEVYAVSFPEYGDTDVFVEENFTKEEMKEYIEQSLEDSIFKFNIDVNENDKLISLITCTRLFGAFSTREIRVDARMVREGETKVNYGVEKTSNYDEIDKLMKGGENNEKA